MLEAFVYLDTASLFGGQPESWISLDVCKPGISYLRISKYSTKLRKIYILICSLCVIAELRELFATLYWDVLAIVIYRKAAIALPQSAGGAQDIRLGRVYKRYLGEIFEYR